MIFYCYAIELIENFLGEEDKEPTYSEICKYKFIEHRQDGAISPQNDFMLYAKRGTYELEKRYKMTLDVE